MFEFRLENQQWKYLKWGLFILHVYSCWDQSLQQIDHVNTSTIQFSCVSWFFFGIKQAVMHVAAHVHWSHMHIMITWTLILGDELQKWYGMKILSKLYHNLNPITTLCCADYTMAPNAHVSWKMLSYLTDPSLQWHCNSCLPANLPSQNFLYMTISQSSTQSPPGPLHPGSIQIVNK